MARLYMTYEDPMVLDGILVISCRCAVTGDPGVPQFSVSQEFSDDPGAAAILSAMRAKAKETADTYAQVPINLGTIVTFCAPS